MQASGIGILAGTDCGNPFCHPGCGLHDELELMVQAGLTAAEALRSATWNPARFLKKTADLGTIGKGKLADAVLLDANPLEAIANTRRIASVIQRGRLFRRADLDALLESAAASVAKGGD